MELLRSAGLYEKDMEIGKEGLNMACILIFGKMEIIQSCVPGYKIDAIYRVENVDRYDDHLIVENNLIEIVSNLLVHREFKSAFPAKLIVEKFYNSEIFCKYWICGFAWLRCSEFI